MFTYQKLVKKLCYDNVDKDSLSIIEKFSVFYIENDNQKIWNFLKNNIIINYDLDFFCFLMFNIKSLKIFNILKNNVSMHFEVNHFINFSLLEDDIYDVINPFFLNSNSSIYDIKFFIKKYFWNHIITDRFEFIHNPNKWNYIENSIIFIRNILIHKLKISTEEMDNFIDFIQLHYNFNNFSIKDFNLHFEENKNILNLDFGYTQEEIEDMDFDDNLNLN